MSKKINCKICGKPHTGCSSCDKMGIYSWKNVACCFEHSVIYTTFVNYCRNKITKEEARVELDNVISNYNIEINSILTEDNQKIYNEIMSDNINIINVVDEIKKTDFVKENIVSLTKSKKKNQENV